MNKIESWCLISDNTEKKRMGGGGGKKECDAEENNYHLNSHYFTLQLVYSNVRFNLKSVQKSFLFF